MRRAAAGLIWVLTAAPLASAADRELCSVQALSFADRGDRIQKFSATVRAPPKQVWESLTTFAGLNRWMPPVLSADFRIGGQIEIGARKGLNAPYSIEYVGYIPEGLLALRLSRLPQNVAAPQYPLGEIIQLEPRRDMRTKVTVTIVGSRDAAPPSPLYVYFPGGTERSLVDLCRQYLPRN
jgi:uncharacterized protein YndB with AHSA1/START domain